MHLRILQERLVSVIQRQGAIAQENRQIAERLKRLLPDRLRQIHARFRGAHDSAQATRMSFVSTDYQNHVEEIVSISAEARLARIQYETHMMLFEARRSLRALQHK